MRTPPQTSAQSRRRRSTARVRAPEARREQLRANDGDVRCSRLCRRDAGLSASRAPACSRRRASRRLPISRASQQRSRPRSRRRIADLQRQLRRRRRRRRRCCRHRDVRAAGSGVDVEVALRCASDLHPRRGQQLRKSHGGRAFHQSCRCALHTNVARSPAHAAAFANCGCFLTIALAGASRRWRRAARPARRRRRGPRRGGGGGRRCPPSTWSIAPSSRFSTSIRDAIRSAFRASMPLRAPSCSNETCGRQPRRGEQADARGSARSSTVEPSSSSGQARRACRRRRDLGRRSDQAVISGLAAAGGEEAGSTSAAARASIRGRRSVEVARALVREAA